jgi:hypothetical protein
MGNAKNEATRIQARNAAFKMLNRVTAGVAFAAMAGVGLLSAVSAHTIPGLASSSPPSSTTASNATGVSSAATSTSSTGIQSSSTGVSQSSSSGVAVSGGS